MKIFSKVLIATLLAAIVFIPSYIYSDAPLRVHLADALGVALAFWIPAMMVRSWNDLKERVLFFAAFVVGGTLIWDVVTAVVIVKRDFLMGGVIVYPLFLIGCFTLFAVQAGVLRLLKLDATS